MKLIVFLLAVFAQRGYSLPADDLGFNSSALRQLPVFCRHTQQPAEEHPIASVPAVSPAVLAECSRIFEETGYNLDAVMGRIQNLPHEKQEQYKRCFEPEIEIIPGSFERLSPATKFLLAARERTEENAQGIIGVIGPIVSIGSSLTNVIRGGEITYDDGYACVYPKDADWRYFTWKKQVFYTFRYVKKILFGTMPVIDSILVVSFKHDGLC